MPNSTPKSKIVEFLHHIGEQERHFNKLETEYRKLASTWLLAALGACGYMLASDNIHPPMDRWLLITAIGIWASIGIYVLYVMDLNVYHQLLDAYFMEGAKLEVEHHEWLYPVRMRILKSQKLKGVTGRVMYYYFISIVLLMGVALFGVWNSEHLQKISWCPWLCTGAIGLGLLLLHHVMSNYSHNQEAKDLIDKYNRINNIQE